MGNAKHVSIYNNATVAIVNMYPELDCEAKEKLAQSAVKIIEALDGLSKYEVENVTEVVQRLLELYSVVSVDKIAETCSK